MTDKTKKQTEQEAEPQPTVVTLVLPVDSTKPAMVYVENGDIGHMSTFLYDGFKDIVVALNDGMTAFVEKVVPNPPTHIKNTPPKTRRKSKKEKKAKTAKAPGKPPFKLIDTNGNQRRLNKMFDPFDLQERFHKTNPGFQFKTLEEAVEVATILIDAGLEKSIKITYSNGKTAQEIPAKCNEPALEEATVDNDHDEIVNTTDDNVGETDISDADTDDEVEDTDDVDPDDEPEGDDSDKAENTDNDDDSDEIAIPETLAKASTATRDIYKIVQNSHLATSIHEAILKGKHHGWKKMKAKQQNVKGIIAMYVDGKEEAVEAIYQIALDSFEYDDPQEPVAGTTPSKQPAPVITAITSPERAAAQGIPTHQSFTLATDDDDDDSSDMSDLSADPTGVAQDNNVPDEQKELV